MKINNFKNVKNAVTPEQLDQQLRKVGDDYEKHFLREMVKSMRSTVHESGFINVNQAEKIFSEQLDGEYVEAWSGKGGIGLSDVIYNQLIEKYGASMGIKPQDAHTKGPIPVTKGAEFRPIAQAKNAGLEIKVDGEMNQQGSPVTMPWSGRIWNHYKLDGDRQIVEALHDNGLKSRMMFSGSTQALKGMELKAGEPLGKLLPGAQTLYWNVNIEKELARE